MVSALRGAWRSCLHKYGIIDHTEFKIGDRSATVIDPFSQEWTIALHIEDVTVVEVNERYDKMGKK